MPGNSGLSTYLSTLINWDKRSIMGQATGLPASSYAEMEQTDLDNVQHGGYPMSDESLNFALVSQLKNKPLFTAPAQSPAIHNIIRNTGQDLSHMVTGFFPGVLHFAEHLPSEATTTLSDIGKMKIPTSAASLFADVRDVGNSPIGQLVPGMSDLAELTTAKGRTQLASHPLFSLMDITPFVGKFAEIAAAAGDAGKLAEGSLESFKSMSPEEQSAKIASDYLTNVKPTARQAFIQGSYVKGAIRGLADAFSSGVTKLSGNNVDIRGAFSSFLFDRGMSPTLTESLVRPSITAGKIRTNFLRRDWNTFMDKQLNGMKQDEIIKLTNLANFHYQGARDLIMNKGPELASSVFDVSPDTYDVLEKYRDFQDSFAQSRLSESDPNLGALYNEATGKDEIVSRDSQAWKTTELIHSVMAAKNKTLNQLADRQDMLDRAQQTVESRKTDLPMYKADQPLHGRPNYGSLQMLLHHATAGLSRDPMTFITTSMPDLLTKMMDSKLSANRLAAIGSDVKKITGDADNPGLIKTLQAAVTNNDYKSARVALRDMSRVFKKQSWQGTNVGREFGGYVNELRSSIVGFDRRITRFDYAQSQVDKHTSTINQLTQKTVAHDTELKRLNQKLQAVWAKEPPARFIPMLTSIAEDIIRSEGRQLGIGDNLISDIGRDPTLGKFSQALGEKIAGKKVDDYRLKVFNELKTKGQILADANINDVGHRAFLEDQMNRRYFQIGEKYWRGLVDHTVQSWQDWAKAYGLDPVYVHYTTAHVPSLNVHVALQHEVHPTQFRTRTVNMQPGVNDIGIAMADQMREIMERDAAKEFLDTYVKHWIKPKSEIIQPYVDFVTADKRKDGSMPHVPISHRINLELAKEYEVWNPGWPLPTGIRANSGDQLMIPKGIANSLRQLEHGQSDFRIPMKGLLHKGTNLYIYSILTGPRHLAHVFFGGLTQTLIRSPGALFSIGDAYRLIHDTSGSEIQALLSEHQLDVPSLNDPQLYQYDTGHKLGRVFSKYLGAPGRMLNHLENSISNINRAAVYLNEAEKEIKLHPELAVHLQRNEPMMAALAKTYKTLIDMDGMTPFERTTIKQVIPFYTFTRHIFRYVLTLPADHPVRAAILSQFANQEEQDWNSGLPQVLQNLFYIGPTDKNGNVQAIDLSNANPFRSIANTMTLSGFLSGLNPFLQLPAELANIGQGEATQVNPLTGQNESQMNQLLPDLLEKFVPEFGALDHFVQFSQQMKILKWTNPYQYKRQLYNYLNIPFYHGSVNLPYLEEKYQMSLYNAASSALEYSIRFGDWSYTDRFQYVPWNGRLYQPQQLQAYFQTVQSASKSGVFGASEAIHLPPTPRIF